MTSAVHSVTDCEACRDLLVEVVRLQRSTLTPFAYATIYDAADNLHGVVVDRVERPIPNYGVPITADQLTAARRA